MIERTSIIVRYIYEHYHMDDWGWNDYIKAISAVAFGFDEPDYNAHALILSAGYIFLLQGDGRNPAL